MTKSERRYRNRLYAGLRDAVDALHFDREVSPAKAKNLLESIKNTKPLKVPKHHPFKRLEK